MLKLALIAAGAFAVAVFATAATGPEAMAAAPKCLNKANKYVACTDKLATRKPRAQEAKLENSMVKSWSTSGDASTRRRPLQLRRQ
jgi:hypothetical protein